MYDYQWDEETHGYLLTTQTGKFVANEIRPVYAEELNLIGFDRRFEFDPVERRPFMWAQKNVYYANGEKVAQLNGTQYGKPLSPEFFFEGIFHLDPVNTANMAAKNADIMDIMVVDTKRRVKELYDKDFHRSDIAYIAFSGGKDSVALLDICNRVLPLSVPVVFSDTDMELPDTYTIWEEIQKRYPEREFLLARPESSALENWKRFGPPSRTIRWCCSVHKSAPALVCLKRKLNKTALQTMAFVGVRREESYSRFGYEDSGAGVKNASQINQMPLLDWGAHEIFLYTFTNDLPMNRAYRYGLTRVGCAMCPESSDKYEWFVDRVYPGLLAPYLNTIIETSSKTFRKGESEAFIGSSGWQARRSGMTLRESIPNPLEEVNTLEVTWQSPYLTKLLFFEWIKTLGNIESDERSEQRYLKLSGQLGSGVPFKYISAQAGGGMVTVRFPDSATKAKLLPLIKNVLRKASACIGCWSCESQCTAGAIHTKDGAVYIDEFRCVHCLKCHDIENGCWRFNSMRETETPQKMLSGINSYFNFGLRENWVATLVDLDDRFFPWHQDHPLGNKMVPSASAWFRQAMLVNSSKKPTALVELFRAYGTSYPSGWDFIWLGLVNNAPLVKWFVTEAQLDMSYSPDELSELFGRRFPELKQSAKDCGLSALKDMLSKSPLGCDGAVTSLEVKGRTVLSITRRAKEVDPLVVLYGMYLIAQKSDRSGFTVRELMSVDFESAYISPLMAFGIEPEMFKRQCQGLQSRYPNFMSCTFTHGLDEITVFPHNYSAEDIIQLALGE
ncbi:MAG: phosphoadenosine phosphosulfate reductase family protein [Peptococcaceae bacterium]|jgi:3'-phosphoadenosine 5'-phosphosulfate sulfotransferase (PAPS reductase)/FAD synthetase/ferredoxin|nr:phosphoadenosine phosphosulfate reductase family protein [Peptococcaceae bacterium]